MRITLRHKLWFIVGATAAWLTISVLTNNLISVTQIRNLVDLEGRIVPRLALAPQLEAEFARLRQSMQDAVAAQDLTALEATQKSRQALTQMVDHAGDAISVQAAVELRTSIDSYYNTALEVSRRLIRGDTDESLTPRIEAMQLEQARVSERIEQATLLGNNEVSEAFSAVREANVRARFYRIGLGVTGLALVLSLSWWASRSILRSVSQISTGFARFATGAFSEPIVVSSNDELRDIAVAANKMGHSLRLLNEDRDRVDWLKESMVALSGHLRGELDLQQVTDRTLHYLAERCDAVVGAFHLAGEGDEFELVVQHALGLEDEALSTVARRSFRLGQGLAGRAAADQQPLILDDPPPGYLLVSSSLGQSSPRAVVVVPLPYLGRTVGVIELALMQPCSARVRELLAASREPVVIALQVARSRQTQQQLLTQARALAEKLAAQEEELRLNNQELESQQDVLRTANEELESQRRVLSEKNDELEAVRVSLQQKAEELTRMSSYKSQFLANMSHELRTPLNSMLILSHLLAENEGKQLSNKQVEYARTIHSAGQDLLSLINQVLDLAKIEAGRQEIHVEPVPVVSVVKHVRRVFEPLAREKGLQLKIEVAQEVPQSIATDRQRLERILTNLLGNAIKFTENGHVALRVRRPRADETLGREGLELEHCIAFEVSDTGIGIAQADAQRVFAPFEQVEGGIDRRHAGTGLGLAISRESAGLIGGELRLLTGPGPGSTFVCYLPEQAPQARVIEALAAASEGPAETTGMRPAVTGEAPGLHLLIVEDDTLIADQLVEIVEERGLSVQVARTGQQALEIARNRRPRGIVLDVKLPDIDGWAVMERLRADAATADIPVHFISAIDSPQRGIALGAVGYLTKPISRDELVGMVRVLVPASEANSPRILVVEDDAKEGASLVELLRAEPIDVLHVRSAQDALGQLAQGGVGCMILDLGLPDMDGLGLLETLRARSDIQYPRVIVHTGRALTRKETRELNAYAEAIILKDGDSAKRLLEEIRLFVRHLKDGLQLGSSPAIHHLASDLSLQGVTLLLAEDDMRTVYALSALLRSKGAEVLVAETGREALQLLEQNPNISLVLMDIMMPEMDGYEAMRQLRSEPRFNQLPVIALTAKAMKGERDRCLEAGASDYLAKPVSSERLFETLGAWLAQPVQDGAVPTNV